MRRGLLFFAKQPYLAGIIVLVWLGSTVLLIADEALPVIEIVTINMLLSLFIIWRSVKH